MTRHPRVALAAFRIGRHRRGCQPVAAALRCALIGALPLMVACGGGGGGGSQDTQDSVTKTVGAAGGTVSLPGGPSLAIPPGALGADTAITIQRSATAPPTGAVTALFQFGPEGTTFSSPASVGFTVPAGTSAAAVHWTRAGSTSEFDPLPTTLAGTTATAGVAHLSRGYVGPAPVAIHAISGTVTGEVAQGVTVGLTGGVDRQTTTGPGGLYRFTGLADGAYTVTPSLAGFSFTPASRQVTVAGADVTGRDFAATRLPADTTPPTVTSTLPPNEWANLSVGSNVSATFSEPVDCSTVTAASFTLAPLRGEPVAGAVSCSGTSALLDPAASLTPGTDFVATLGTGVKDLAGNAMAAPYAWGFRTAGGLIPPLTVQATVPARDAFGAAIDKPVTATFSNLLRCATVTASSFTLSGPSGPVAGTVSCSGTFVAFTPAAPLAQGAVHTATLTKDVTNLVNVGMSVPYTWSFTTLVLPAGAWGAPVELDAVSNLSDWPRLAVAANGHGVAVWSSWADDGFRVRAALLEPGGSWGPATTLASSSPPGNPEVGYPRVALDAGGAALALWATGVAHQDHLPTYGVAAASWSPGGWTIPELVEDSGLLAGGGGFRIGLAMNGGGDAMAVHARREQQYPSTSVVSLDRPAGGAVGAPLVAQTMPSLISDPEVVVDAGGTATSAWLAAGSTRQIYATRHVPGVGWSPAEVIDTGLGFPAIEPRLAVDGAGRVTAVWTQGSLLHASAARFVPGVGWGAAQDLEPGKPGSSGRPAVAFAASGEGLVVWVASTEILAVRYTPAGGFSAPARLDLTAGVGFLGEPDVAIDSAGNGMAVWQRPGANGRQGIFASPYQAGVGWAAPEPIGPALDDFGGSSRPRVAADGQGRFTAAWMRAEPAGWTIRARRWE